MSSSKSNSGFGEKWVASIRSNAIQSCSQGVAGIVPYGEAAFSRFTFPHLKLAAPKRKRSFLQSRNSKTNIYKNTTMADSGTKKRKMARVKIALALLAGFTSFFAALLPAAAYYYNITYDCMNGICVRGETATWHLRLSNDGLSELEYIGVDLISVTNTTPFLHFRASYYPLSSYRGDLVVVRQNSHKDLNLSAKIPKANFGQQLIYKPCFTITITDSYIIARDNLYESTQCFNENLTMNVVECTSSSHCNTDEYCNNNKCVKLNCGSCQYIKDNKCLDYPCCSSAQCGIAQSCTNNSCINLECSAIQYIYNHTCNELSCGFDEYVSNRTCIKLECFYDEYTFNHSCIRLNCSQDEKIVNRTCIKLECAETEYAKNHDCFPLDCSPDEAYVNHECRPLDCYFFQDIISHSCVNNKKTIFKSVLELAAVIAIIAFFVLDFTKYEKKHKKPKTVEKAAQQEKDEGKIKDEDKMELAEDIKENPAESGNVESGKSASKEKAEKK